MYNFDRIIDRRGTNAYKLDLRQKYFGTEDVVPLWVADMDFAAPPEVQQEIQQRAAHEIYGYTIRKEDFAYTIADWCLYKHNWKVEPDWVEYAPGVVPSLAFCILAFTNEGDNVIINTPVYPPFYSVVTENKRQLIRNSLSYKNGQYYFDFESFEKEAAKPETKVFILCNPHNPVGRAWTKEELLRISDICLRHNVLVLADEIHSDLIWRGKQHVAFASISDDAASNCITFMAPSKTFNIAGFNTSYIIASNPKLLNAYKKTLSRLQLHLGHVFSNIAVISAYTKGRNWLAELTSYLESNIRMVHDFFASNMPEVTLPDTEATYLLWLNFNAWQLSQRDLKEVLINKAKVGLNDGVTFGVEGKGFMRLNVASPRAVLEQALQQINSVRPK